MKEKHFQLLILSPPKRTWGIKMKYVYMRLPELLSERGISRAKLCRDLNLQRTNVNRYYNNQSQRYDCDFLARICEYLDCDIYDLLELREKD